MTKNILVTSRELDVAGYDMLARVAEDASFKVYIAVSNEHEMQMVKGRCIGVPMPPVRSKLSWRVVFALRRLIKQYGIRVVFSPSSAGLSNAVLASVGTGAKNIGYRGTQAKVRRADPTYYLGVLNPLACHIVCETADIREYLLGMLPERKLSVLTKPFDVAWVQEAINNPIQVDGVPADALTCVYIGMCKGRPFKGLRLLLEAFNLVRVPNMHLVFVGSYDAEDAEWAKQSPKASQIHMVGPQQNANAYLPGQGLFVLPSTRDASPRVVREAMACGLPCVVSDIPGAKELIVHEQTGLLFQAGSATALAAAIERLANNPNERCQMGKAGRQRIAEVFSPVQYAEGFKQLFRSIG